MDIQKSSTKHELLREIQAVIFRPAAGRPPKILLTKDHGVLCEQCVREEWAIIRQATFDDGPFDQQWAAAELIDHTDGPDIRCDHCFKLIKSAERRTA